MKERNRLTTMAAYCPTECVRERTRRVVLDRLMLVLARNDDYKGDGLDDKHNSWVVRVTHPVSCCQQAVDAGDI